MQFPGTWKILYRLLKNSWEIRRIYCPITLAFWGACVIMLGSILISMSIRIHIPFERELYLL